MTPRTHLPRFQQRFQIYVVDSSVDPRLASVAPGTLVTNVQLQTDPDAPFLLRGRCYRVAYNSIASHTQVGVESISFRLAGPDQDYRSSVLVPQNLQMAFGGQSASWKPVYPQVFYPSRTTIQFDFQNNSTTETLTNVVFYFLGVKLYDFGINPAYTYPPKMRATQYAYGANYSSPPNPNNPTAALQNVTTAFTQSLNILQIKNDADFVCRSIQAGPSYAPFALELFITLRDENRKAYSNLPVHFEVLAGPSTGNYLTGSAGSIPAIGTGNPLPGIIFPELYLPKNHILYWDVVRNDSGYVGAETIPNFPITLLGSRVYAI